jgi:hypothetical protein
VRIFNAGERPWLEEVSDVPRQQEQAMPVLGAGFTCPSPSLASGESASALASAAGEMVRFPPANRCSLMRSSVSRSSTARLRRHLSTGRIPAANCSRNDFLRNPQYMAHKAFRFRPAAYPTKGGPPFLNSRSGIDRGSPRLPEFLQARFEVPLFRTPRHVRRCPAQEDKAVVRVRLGSTDAT